jgi:hypothetical protein
VIATLHLQDVLELAPARAGLLLLPLSLAVVAGSALAPRLRASSPVIISGGVGLIAVGSAVAAALLSAAGLVVWGRARRLGLGAASVSATALGASAVAERDRATAGGLLNTAAPGGDRPGRRRPRPRRGHGRDGSRCHRAGFTVAADPRLGAAVMPAVLLRATETCVVRGRPRFPVASWPLREGDARECPPEGTVAEPHARDRTAGEGAGGVERRAA